MKVRTGKASTSYHPPFISGVGHAGPEWQSGTLTVVARTD